MIEAATASVSNSQIIRSAVEQSSSAQTIAANPTRIQKVAVSNAPYLSPYVRLSPGTKPILVVRDSDTGTQVNQYPTPAQIRAYQTAASTQAKISASSAPQGSVSDVKQVSYDEAKAVLQNSVQYQEIKKEVARSASSEPAPEPEPPQPAPQPISVSVDA
jgi:hypothetical protein